MTRAVKVEVAALGVGEDEETDDPVAPVDDPVDVAPDEGAFAYTVTTEARKLVKGTLTFAPGQPRAGKAFRLAGTSLEFNDVGAVKATSAFTATLGGKKFGKGCSWRIPLNAKKKVCA